MGDLISRSALIELIKGHFDLVLDEVTEDAVCRMIEEQPTAYDMENVVRELEMEKEYAEKTYDMLKIKEARGKKIGMVCAIEIVKGGGIDDTERD